MGQLPESPLHWRDLEPAECLELLGSQRIGRLAFVDKERPVILPVTYLLHDGEVVFRTDEGSKLHASVWKARVAFEVDGLDPDTQTGWSVLVKGTARELHDDAELDQVRRLPLSPWAPGPKGHYVKVGVEEMTGRQITARDLLASLWWG